MDEPVSYTGEPLPVVAGYSVPDLLGLVEELTVQACCVQSSPTVRLDHMFMSTYEEACDLLAVARPDRWTRTRTGIERIEPS